MVIHMLTFLIKRYNHVMYVYRPVTKGFIVIHFTDSAGHLARVEVLNNRRSASKRKSLVHQILFTNVKSVVPCEVQGTL